MGRIFERKLIEGEPIRVGNRTVTPLVRRTVLYMSAAAARGGAGWMLVRLTPVAVVEREGEQERRIPIRDTTGSARLGLLLGGLVIALVFRYAWRRVGI